jgi:hypothetical protein
MEDLQETSGGGKKKKTLKRPSFEKHTQSIVLTSHSFPPPAPPFMDKIPQIKVDDDGCIIPSYLCPDEMHPLCDTTCVFGVHNDGTFVASTCRNKHAYADKNSLARGLRNVAWQYKTRSPQSTAKITPEAWSAVLRYCDFYDPRPVAPPPSHK